MFAFCFEIYKFSARHQRHECDTSATRVLHERQDCDTSEKILILLTTYFHTPIFTI